ncbi:MAG TPA: hypothetical protein VGH94_09250 [Acidimicrobiales bacterium]
MLDVPVESPLSVLAAVEVDVVVVVFVAAVGEAWWVAARTPLRATRPTTLAEPATVRARRAGWGRLLMAAPDW